MNYGYPKIELWLSKIQHDFWISKNVFQDIHKSIFGYPKMNCVDMEMNGYPKLHIHNYFVIS